MRYIRDALVGRGQYKLVQGIKHFVIRKFVQYWSIYLTIDLYFSKLKFSLQKKIFEILEANESYN